MKKHAIYPGSFDPLSNGHINLVSRAVALFETVTVAVAVNSRKKSLFSLQERVQMIQKAFQSQPSVKVESFEGLLTDFVSQKQNSVVLRGIRTNADFEYELGLAQANRHLSSTFETIFMMTDPEYSFLTSSMIREIVSLGGNTHGMLPEFIEEALRLRIKEMDG